MPDVVNVPQVGDPITARWGASVANAINANTPQIGRGQTPAGRVGDPPPPNFSSRARAIPYGITLTPNGDATDDSAGTMTLLIHEPSIDYDGIYNPYHFQSANRPRGGQYVVVADDIPADFSDGIEVFLRVRYDEGICWFVARTGGASYAKTYCLTGSVDSYDDSVLLFSSRISGTNREYVPQVSAPIMMPRPASNPDVDDLYSLPKNLLGGSPFTYRNASIQRTALTAQKSIAASESETSIQATVSNGFLSLAGFFDAMATGELTGQTLDHALIREFTAKTGTDHGEFGGVAIPAVFFDSETDHSVPGSSRSFGYLSLYYIARWLRDKILNWAKEYTDEQIAALESKLNNKIDTADNALSKRIDDLSSGA